MKKIIYIIFALFLLVFIDVNVYAECSDEEIYKLNQELSLIKITSDITKTPNGIKTINPSTGEVIDEENYDNYVTLRVVNLSDKFYLIISNKTDGTANTYRSDSFANGVLSVDYKNNENINNLVINIYTTNLTSCPNKEMYTQSYVIPKYNTYSESSYCERHSSEKYCQSFVNFEISEDQFNSFVDKDEATIQKKANDQANIAKKLQDRKQRNRMILIISGISLIAIGVVTTVVIIIRRKGRLL